jgi:hypothetical protein
MNDSINVIFTIKLKLYRINEIINEIKKEMIMTYKET